MKKALRDRTRNEEGNEIRYFLFEDTEGGKAEYSFMIELHSDMCDEINLVSDVCETKSEAEAWYAKLFEGCVTPGSLFDIAEDYIVEKSSY